MMRDGVALWTERDGSGPPLLLIAGLGYSSWCWRELAASLRDQHEVITFDNRGTGRSHKPPGPYSIEMLADDAAAVLDGCNIDSAHVLGHSMGGYIALTLALRHPDKVRSLVLASTSPGGPDCEPMPQVTVDVWRKAASMTPQEYARFSMPKSFSPGWTSAHPEEFEKILQRRLEYPTPMECWSAQYAACAEFVTRGADVPAIRKPALVLHGDADNVVPFANGRLLSQRLEGAQWAPLAGQGHLPFLEQPGDFAGRVRRFLEGVAA